jgi:hypothetical protein
MANLEKQKDPARVEEGFQVQIPYGLFSTGQVAGLSACINRSKFDVAN